MAVNVLITRFVLNTTMQMQNPEEKSEINISGSKQVETNSADGKHFTIRRILSWLLISMLVGITLFWLGMMIVFSINFWRSYF